MPANGRPGALGSERLGVFEGVFPRLDFNMRRGTYVDVAHTTLRAGEHNDKRLEITG